MQLSLIPDEGAASLKEKAAKDLIRIADAMESAEPGSAFARQLSRDYKAASIAAGIIDVRGKVKNATGLSKKQIDESRAKALAKITGYLDNLDYSLK